MSNQNLEDDSIESLFDEDNLEDEDQQREETPSAWPTANLSERQHKYVDAALKHESGIHLNKQGLSPGTHSSAFLLRHEAIDENYNPPWLETVVEELKRRDYKDLKLTPRTVIVAINKIKNKNNNDPIAAGATTSETDFGPQGSNEGRTRVGYPPGGTVKEFQSQGDTNYGNSAEYILMGTGEEIRPTQFQRGGNNNYGISAGDEISPSQFLDLAPDPMEDVAYEPPFSRQHSYAPLGDSDIPQGPANASTLAVSRKRRNPVGVSASAAQSRPSRAKREKVPPEQRPLPLVDDNAGGLRPYTIAEISRHPYYDDGYKYEGETKQQWKRRVANAREAMKIHRKPTKPPAEKDKFNTNKQATDARRRQMAAENEKHEKAMEGYRYKSKFLEEKRQRHAHNSQARAEGLRLRRVHDQANAVLPRVPTPSPPPDSDDDEIWDMEFEERFYATQVGRQKERERNLQLAEDNRKSGLPPPNGAYKCIRCHAGRRGCGLNGSSGPNHRDPPCDLCIAQHCEDECTPEPSRRLIFTRNRKKGTGTRGDARSKGGARKQVSFQDELSLSPRQSGQHARNPTRGGNERRGRVTKSVSPPPINSRRSQRAGRYNQNYREPRGYNNRYDDEEEEEDMDADEREDRERAYEESRQMARTYFSGSSAHPSTSNTGYQSMYNPPTVVPTYVLSPQPPTRGFGGPGTENLDPFTALQNSSPNWRYKTSGQMDTRNDFQQQQYEPLHYSGYPSQSDSDLVDVASIDTMHPSYMTGILPSGSQANINNDAPFNMESVDRRYTTGSSFSPLIKNTQPHEIIDLDPPTPPLPNPPLPPHLTYCYDGSQISQGPQNESWLHRDKPTLRRGDGRGCHERYRELDPHVPASEKVKTCGLTVHEGGNEDEERDEDGNRIASLLHTCELKESHAKPKNFNVCGRCIIAQATYLRPPNLNRLISQSWARLCFDCADRIWTQGVAKTDAQSVEECRCWTWLRDAWLCNKHRKEEWDRAQEMILGAQEFEIRSGLENRCLGCGTNPPSSYLRAWACRLCRDWVIPHKPTWGQLGEA